MAEILFWVPRMNNKHMLNTLMDLDPAEETNQRITQVYAKWWMHGVQRQSTLSAYHRESQLHQASLWRSTTLISACLFTRCSCTLSSLGGDGPLLFFQGRKEQTIHVLAEFSKLNLEDSRPWNKWTGTLRSVESSVVNIYSRPPISLRPSLLSSLS